MPNLMVMALDHDHFGSFSQAAAGVNTPELQMADNDYALGRIVEYLSQRPVWAKTAIYGALGYFISPIDAIPDITPVIGYADDLAVLAAAVATVATYITADVKQRAAEKLRGWFGA